MFPLSAQTNQTGQQLFDSTCAGCHGLDGRGGEHAPNIAGNMKLQQGPDADLQHIIENGVPASGMPAFRSVFKSDQIKAIVSYLRTLGGGQNLAQVSGDGAAGQALFFGKAHCAACHAVNGKGGSLASDLSGYGKAHSPDELRQQILSHNTDEYREITRVITRQGRVYEGLTRNQDNFSLQLQTFKGDFLFMGKADLAAVEYKKSPMLSTSDIDNLIIYLSRTPAK